MEDPARAHGTLESAHSVAQRRGASVQCTSGMDGTSEARRAGKNGDGRANHGLLFRRNSLDYAVHLAIGDSSEHLETGGKCTSTIASLDWLGGVVLLGAAGRVY